MYMNMKKAYIHFFILFVCIVVLGCSIAAQWNVIAGNPFKKAIYFEYPSYITADAHKNLYIIDKSMKRILKLDGSGRVEYSIDGGKTGKGKFFMANEIEVDGGGSIYVINNVLDADYANVDREEIIKYNSRGKFERVIRSIDYTTNGDKPVRKGRICSLKVTGSELYYFYKTKDAVELHEISLADGTDRLCSSIHIEDADTFLIDIDKSDERNLIAYTTKRGEIFGVEDGKTALLYDSTRDTGGTAPSVPWEVETDSKGNVYFTDLGKGEIDRINSDGTISVELSTDNKPGPAVFYCFEITGDGFLATLNGSEALYKGIGGQVRIYLDHGDIAPANKLYALFVLVQLIAAIAILLYFIRSFYMYVRKKEGFRTFKQILFLITVILVSAVMVSDMIFTSFTDRYEKEVFKRLETAVKLVSKSIDGDELGRVDSLKDYMGEEYQSIRAQVHGALDNSRSDWSKSMYGVVYKVYGGRVYAFMYYDDSVGMKYPINNDYMDSPHRQAYENGKITVIKDSDTTGEWMYGLGPVYASDGKIVGIVEVGTDMYGFTLENRKLIRNILLDVATFLVIIILLMVEITVLNSILAKRRKTLALQQPVSEYYDVRLIRPLGFIVFAAVNMAASFVPIMMKGMYRPVPGLPENVVLGLPITAEMLFMAAASVIAGYLIDRHGWFRMFISGAFILAAGAFLSGLAGNAALFIAARGIAGFGYGFALISMQSYVMLSPAEEIKSEGISALNSGALAGMNCGVVIGAMIAERTGFSRVFYIAFAVALLSVIFAVKYMAGIKKADRKESFRVPGKTAGLGGFLSNAAIVRFLLFVCMPMAAGTMFLNYFFPLYAEGSGISPSNIGRAFLLNGLCIIYLGPVLSRLILKNMGARKAILLAGVLAVAGMLVFSVKGTLLAAFVTVTLLGIAEGFGITSKVTYFVGLEAVGKLGEGKAMGYYALAENTGQMLGPVIFGTAMSLGAARGVGIIGVVLLALLVLFILGGLNIKSQKIANRL